MAWRLDVSTDGTERMISVAELLRREGVDLEDERNLKGRVAATAAGVMALCGATVTGMLAFAPNLSTAFFPSDPNGIAALPYAAGMSALGGTGVTADSVRPAGVAQELDENHPLAGNISGSLGFRAAGHQVPAMSQLGSDDFGGSGSSTDNHGSTSEAPAGEGRSSAPDESEDAEESGVTSTGAPTEESGEPSPEPTKTQPPAEEPPPEESAPEESTPSEESSPEDSETSPEPSKTEAPSEEPPPEEEAPAEESETSEAPTTESSEPTEESAPSSE